MREDDTQADMKDETILNGEDPQSGSRSRVANLSKNKGHPRLLVDGEASNTKKTQKAPFSNRDVLFSITVFSLVPFKMCLASRSRYFPSAHTGHFFTVFHEKAFSILFQVLSFGVAALRQLFPLSPLFFLTLATTTVCAFQNTPSILPPAASFFHGFHPLHCKFSPNR